MTDAEKLRTLALWHDQRDRQSGNLAREVQNDLRRIADLLDTLQKYREEYENPVPDYTLRRTLRDRLFSLAAAPMKPEG